MRNKVIATLRQNYGGEWFNAGRQIVTKTQTDAEDLVALGYAKWDGDGYEVKVETAEGKRRYKRRDMRPEH